jgi:polyferredoxin
MPAVRWAVQLAYAAFFCLVGYEFYLFYAQAVWQVPITAHRPPAVEGFLPVSALVSLKHLLATGEWDRVHPAGLTILLAAITGSVVSRKTFCSWICPGGTFSRVLELAAKKTIYRRGRALRMPRWLDLPLLSLKYLLLAFFVWTVFVSMPARAVEMFLLSPYNIAADAKMLLFFFELTAVGVTVLAVLVLLSYVVKNFWCRYLCPYGALLGIFSLASPSRVVRDADACNDCRACTRACPVEIPVHARGSVWTAECTGCLNCVAACTTEGALGVTRRGKKSLSPWLVPALGIGVLLAFWITARATGHWVTEVPTDVLVDVYRQADQIAH